MKKIAIFGSTGSIGTQTLDFIRKHEGFKADIIVANSNAELLIEQIKEFSPSVAGIINSKAYEKLKSEGLDVKLVTGDEAVNVCAQSDCDRVVISAVGFSAMPALLACIKNGKEIALANKECIVAAGELISKLSAMYNASIIPVDSEHSAVWQCLASGEHDSVAEIILTASGGRYYGYEREQLDEITPSEAVKHPNWRMGKKISVDSATMMNKALEIVEARWLFDTENIGYIIHPQSIIHSMVRYKDGSVIAQMAVPDMRLPISVALSYPHRAENAVEPLSFDKPLTFLPKREDVFFAPTLAYKCIKEGGSMAAIMDAANESAVKMFLDGKIKFGKIAETVRNAMESNVAVQINSFSDVIEVRKEIIRKTEDMEYTR